MRGSYEKNSRWKKSTRVENEEAGVDKIAGVEVGKARHHKKNTPKTSWFVVLAAQEDFQ